MRVPGRKADAPRDDAIAQPESGYPDDRVPTQPSADALPDELLSETKGGSEAEFDSPKKCRGQ